MKSIKRKHAEIIQSRGYVVKKGGVGREWVPRIEKTYEFHSVYEFLNEFHPAKPTKNLLSSISEAYTDCKTISFNTGNGNQTFNFFK